VSTTSRPNKRTALIASLTLIAASAAVIALPALPAVAATAVTINGATTFQTMTGFGASEAFGQASAVMNEPAAVQKQALDLLFSPTTGAGLNILRNQISGDAGITIEPNAPSSPSATPTYLPIGTDQGQLTLSQTIKANYGITNIYADAWSSPGFMKDTGIAINGGTLCGVPGTSCASGDWRQAYANYLVQYAKDYAAAGVPLTYLGPLNEPSFTPSGYDGMTLTPAQAANLLDVLGPTLASSGLSTKVSCCAVIGWDSAQQYAAAIEADPAALAATSVFTSHGYSQGPNSALAGWSKPAWETEWATFTNSFDTAWDDGTGDSGITWAQNIYNGLANANLNAFLYWWGIGVSSIAANGCCIVSINGSTVSASGRLWALANYARYIQPGAVRIGATSPTSVVEVTAYKNTNGTVAIVALNTGSTDSPTTFSLANTGIPNGANVTPILTNATTNAAAQTGTTVSGGQFATTIPARSQVTYVIPATASTGNTVTVTSPGNQTGTVGTPVSVQIHATDSATGQSLAYSATGLPAGLSINAAGLISGTPTSAGVSTVAVTAADSTGASGTAIFTFTVNGTGGGCHVTYTVANQWTGGFTANVTIGNTGTTAVNGWTLGFTFPGDQTITNAWNGIATQSGRNVTITNASYNAAIPAGGSTSMGFNGAWTSNNTSPTTFTVNGAACG
jgi:O-glycosyl hydrolase